MTQFARPSLDASIDDGITLSTKLNGAFPALYTNHAGAAAPPSPEKGQGWVDTSGEGAATPVLVSKVYSGSVWHTLGTLNLSTGAYSTSGGLSTAGGIVSGPIYFPSGTAALPGIAFDGDVNTGIYRIGSDNIGFTLGGVARGTWSTSMLELTTNFTLNRASPTLSLDGTGTRSILGKTSGTNRWGLQLGSSAAESGLSSGSDFYLYRYDDAGGSLGAALQINRATGDVGINNVSVAGIRLYVATQAAEAIQDARSIRVLNANTASDASTNIEFATAAGALRAKIRGQREAATNHGRMILSSALSGVAVDVLSLDSNKLATFTGGVSVMGQISTQFGYRENGPGGGWICTQSGNDGTNYLDRIHGSVNLGGFSPSMWAAHISGQWYGYRFETTSGGAYFEMQNNGTIVRNTDSYQVQWVAPSDQRIKKDITPIESDALSLLCSVEIKSFNWNPPDYESKPDQGLPITRTDSIAPSSADRVRAGFIAQQLQTLIPEAVISRPVQGFEGGLLAADNGALVPWLVRAVQQLSAQNADLSMRLAALEKSGS